MHVLSVTQVTAYLKDLIEDDPLLADIWIRGEVTNLSRSAAGHMYFCLTADGAQVNCVLFRGSQRGMLALPRGGEAILAHGRVAIYETRGQYQLIVDNVAPEGAGILQLLFEEVRARLEADGMFAVERKRPLPVMPATIGVVTSAQGAVWHDIQTVVARRYPLTQLLLAPSSVQGPNAPEELIAALQALQEDGRSDVIILARGGGAAEDLACFNDERLARAIFASSIPIVSAIGHETDVTIADLVADVRAPTPSAAAELCVPNRVDMLVQVALLIERGHERVLDHMRDVSARLNQSLAEIRRHAPGPRIDRARQDVDGLTTRAQASIGRTLESRRQRVDHLHVQARLLDPSDVLRRGYAIVSTLENGTERRLASAAAASSTKSVTIRFSDGKVTARIDGDQP